jgi:hypothetical protein
MGFALGGSFVWSILYVPPHHYAEHNKQAEERTAEKDQNHGFWEKTTDDPVAYFTAWLVGFTGVLAISTIGLWIVTWRASTSQARDMQASIAVANRSANISERALTELEAPFLSVKITEDGITRSYGETGHHFHTLRLVIANFGRTPARIIEMADKAAFVEKNEGLPPEVNPAFASRISIPYGVIAPPQGESQGWSFNLFAFTLRYLAERVEPLKTNELFFYGFVRYETIFRKTYRMGFCYMFDKRTLDFDRRRKLQLPDQGKLKRPKPRGRSLSAPCGVCAIIPGETGEPVVTNSCAFNLCT